MEEKIKHLEKTINKAKFQVNFKSMILIFLKFYLI